MAYGDIISDNIPGVLVTPGPDFATDINELLADILACIQSKVTPAGFSMTSDLTFRSADGTTYYAPTNLHRASFYSQGSLLSAATYPTAVYVKSGELYYNDSAGNQVQVTSAGFVNAAPGNITGTNYGTGGKEVNWDDANLTYRMRSGTATDDYADVSMDDLLLNDGSGNFARVTAGAMAADLTFTLPVSAPGTDNAVITCSTAGVLAASVNPTLDGLTSTALITAQAGVTASANQDFTVSGTGRYNHGDIAFMYGPKEITQLSGAGSVAFTFDTANGAYALLSNAATVAGLQLVGLPVGARIRTITIHWYSGGAGTPTFRLYRCTNTTSTLVGAGWGTAVAGAAVLTADVSAALNETILSTANYIVYMDAAAANDRITAVGVTIDQP